MSGRNPSTVIAAASSPIATPKRSQVRISCASEVLNALARRRGRRATSNSGGRAVGTSCSSGAWCKYGAAARGLIARARVEHRRTLRSTTVSAPLLLLGLAALEQLPPAARLDLDAVLARCGPDAPPRAIAFGIAHAFDLVEARHRVAYVLGVGQRLLPLLGERERAVGQVVLLRRRHRSGLRPRPRPRRRSRTGPRVATAP